MRFAACFPKRLQAAIHKALSHFDELRESHGDKPTVTVSLGLRGREIENTQELERFLEELRKRLLAELETNHRVRLE